MPIPFLSPTDTASGQHTERGVAYTWPSAAPATNAAPLTGNTDGTLAWGTGASGPAGYATTIGDGVSQSFTITHGLGTRDVLVQVYEAVSPWTQVEVSTVATTKDTVGLTFQSAPFTNEYRVVVQAIAAASLSAIRSATLDFGSVPSYSKSFTVTDTLVSSTSRLLVVQNGSAQTGRQADENEMDALMLSAVAGTGQFTVYATAMPGPVAGLYGIYYWIA